MNDFSPQNGTPHMRIPDDDDEFVDVDFDNRMSPANYSTEISGEIDAR